jgi:hypothetical protein
MPLMERVVHKTTSHEDARRWDIAQHRAMTPEERQAIAKELRRRAYGEQSPDIREAQRSP